MLFLRKYNIKVGFNGLIGISLTTQQIGKKLEK